MSQMAGKIISAELVFRIQTLGAQILRAFRELRPILLCEMPVALLAPQCIQQNQHVPTLFDGHLVSSVCSPPPYTCPSASG